MLISARKELSDYGRVTEELKRRLQTIKEQYEESAATRQIAELQEAIPIIERMNDIRKELLESQKEGLQERLERGELRPEVIMFRNEGLGSYEGDLEQQAQETQTR